MGVSESREIELNFDYKVKWSCIAKGGSVDGMWLRGDIESTGSC